MSARDPILCIIPPHMLREIARRGGSEHRQWALQTLALTEQHRAQRLAMGQLSAGAEAEAVVGQPLSPGEHRLVYNAHNQQRLPGTLARQEGGPASADGTVNEAYDGLGATYDLYMQAYGRDSLDGQGMPLLACVHYGRNYDNAFWDGQEMIFGDGDGKLFLRFTRPVEVIGHELTHAVTQFTANLTYTNQAGALNESISDVFGALVKQRLLGQTAAAADWLIGEGLLAPGVKGVALRSMKAPGTAYNDPVLGKDPQPAHMDQYQRTRTDNGGVHINSGIPNHAFYLAAVAIGGYAWERAGKIWYTALTRYLRPTATFRNAAVATVRAAGDLFGKGSREQQAVQAAWHEVGVPVA